ncbi:unnamed protein product [Staurois parvus]|uniref:Uncharacterized protein n=1 Tax=Staurois parvus TaxID=386267 RepID=A0ABN9C4U9_9NEOB|nr:unnamed protein product [Staurois parvus]
MMAPMRMEEDRSHMTEKILNLTLEIIYLLTGEMVHLLTGEVSESHHHPPTSIPDPYKTEDTEDSRSHQEDDGAADRRGSYKVSGCHCLFLHGGSGSI